VGAWQVLATVGWVFIVVGGLDVGLVWFPPAFGNQGWEFGSITAALNGLPLPVMGTALVLASGVARGHGVSARTAMVIAGLLAVVGLGAPSSTCSICPWRSSRLPSPSAEAV
jgi:hypothetical protein